MGSTTQNMNEPVFRPERARHYVEQQRWDDAITECEGMLNGNDRRHFNDAEVWTMYAIALIWKKRQVDADWAIEQAMDSRLVGSTVELRVRFLREKLRFYTIYGKVAMFEHTLAELVEYKELSAFWLSTQTAIVHSIAAARLRTTRGTRDQLLEKAAQCCASAEQIAELGSEEVNQSARVNNLTCWFLAVVNQSHGAHDKRIEPTLTLIEAYDPDRAKSLRKKLRMRKYLGVHVHP